MQDHHADDMEGQEALKLAQSAVARREISPGDWLVERSECEDEPLGKDGGQQESAAAAAAASGNASPSCAPQHLDVIVEELEAVKGQRLLSQLRLCSIEGVHAAYQLPNEQRLVMKLFLPEAYPEAPLIIDLESNDLSDALVLKVNAVVQQEAAKHRYARGSRCRPSPGRPGTIHLILYGSNWECVEAWLFVRTRATPPSCSLLFSLTVLRSTRCAAMPYVVGQHEADHEA